MSNRQIVFRYYSDLWDKGDAALIDTLLAPDFNFRGSLGAELRGREAFRGYYDNVRLALPDVRHKVDDVVLDEDHAAVRLTISGTHSAPLLGIAATGKRVEYVAAGFFRIADRQIAQAMVLGDMLGLLRQLGATSLPAA